MKVLELQVDPDVPVEGALGLADQAEAGVVHQDADVGNPVPGADGRSRTSTAARAIRVTDPAEPGAAFDQAGKLAARYQVPVVEAILERVTDLAMPTTNDTATWWSSGRSRRKPGHAPTSIRTPKVWGQHRKRARKGSERGPPPPCRRAPCAENVPEPGG